LGQYRRGNSITTIYQKLSDERKKLQGTGDLPDWFVTPSWQLFKDKYLHEARGLRDTHLRIASTLSKHMVGYEDEWEGKFFNLLWKGWLAPSTPVLSNTGTNKGMPVSCSGQYIGDSIDDFYSNRKETAILTKNGFGTSGYLGDIRPRGSKIAKGGTASGVLPVYRGFVQDMRDVAQGTSRRGAWAGYLPIDHEDFFEVAETLHNEPDDLNVGWVVTDHFIKRLDTGDLDAYQRYQRALKVKAITGKGYFFFVDKVNRANPTSYKIHGLEVNASNLCTEIMLHSSQTETFTCVLSSLNLTKYDEWKDTDAIFDSIVLLDCIASEFLKLAAEVPGLEKAIAGTTNGRPLGLGTLGFHTYLQQKSIPFESFEAHQENHEIFGRLKREAERATTWLAEKLGEPKYCKGLGRRNTHLLAVAPNTSSALLCGGVSQGIEPVVANVYNQPTAAGEIYRVNPVFLSLAKTRVGWDDALVKGIIANNGSVQHLDWLTDHEKEVFKTAYEISQEAILRLASTRQQYIDQGQSINLFFDADADEGEISRIHEIGFKDPNIKALYYMRSKAGVQASSGECVACEG
jgi:ribonucleoside-diphosphate reductase alpha chain